MRETFFEAHSYVNWYASRQFKKTGKEILFRSDFDLNSTAHIFFLLWILLAFLGRLSNSILYLKSIFRLRSYLSTIFPLYNFCIRFELSCHSFPHPFEYVEMIGSLHNKTPIIVRIVKPNLNVRGKFSPAESKSFSRFSWFPHMIVIHRGSGSVS